LRKYKEQTYILAEGTTASPMGGILVLFSDVKHSVFQWGLLQ